MANHQTVFTHRKLCQPSDIRSHPGTMSPLVVVAARAATQCSIALQNTACNTYRNANDDRQRGAARLVCSKAAVVSCVWVGAYR